MNIRHLGDILGREAHIVCRDGLTMDARVLSVKDNWLSVAKTSEPNTCYFIPYAAVQYIRFECPAGH